MPVAPTTTLLRGAEIPQVGLGTAGLGDDAAVATAVATAIASGYRLIDTAENYFNERGVGQGIRDAGLARDELFVTTKFNKEWHSVDGVRRAFEQSAEKLGLDYIDLLLIHWPNPGQGTYVDAFEGLLALHAAGLVKAIGTSNFSPAHLEDVRERTGQSPDVNQIKLNPYTTRDAYRSYAAEHGIVVEAWSPIGPGTDLLDHPVLTEIGLAHGKTAAQVTLRWEVQLGTVTVPRSGNAGRIAANIDIFDFELSDAEMAAIGALDKGESEAPDAEKFGH